MILTLFIVLIILSLVMYIGGYYLKYDFIKYFGLVLLVLTGVGVLDGLQYQTSTIVDTDYNYEGSILTTSQDNIQPQYSVFGETTLGFIIISISAFTLILDLIFTKSFKGSYGNEYDD